MGYSVQKKPFDLKEFLSVRADLKKGGWRFGRRSPAPRQPERDEVKETESSEP